MLVKVGELVLPAITRSGPVEAWIIDDTGFPREEAALNGVARQYCGKLDKQGNCQVAVSLSLANRDASLPITYRLYLPEDWANDRARRHKAKVPETIAFQTKPQIALDQIKPARAAGLRVAAATAPNCAPRSPLSACPTSRVSAATPWSGQRAPSLCRRRLVGVSGDHANCFDATSSISQSRSRCSLSARQRKLGEPLPGATAPRTGCHRALRGSGCARRTPIQS